MNAPASAARRPLLSVIVPCRNAASVLDRSLGALRASDLSAEWWELIVVDDGSTDESPQVAAHYADTVLRLPQPSNGPSYSRNRGAELARGELLLFVDADVCVHPDVLTKVTQAFREDAGASAVIGRYDDAPPARGLVSQYRNLLRHHFWHRVPGAVDHFWAGCGAVRRDAFMAAGMFNEWHFRSPQLEDELLGRQLRALGRTILLRPDIQATHLKAWTLGAALRDDLFTRGVMHTRLVQDALKVEGRGVAGWLRSSERVSELMVAMATLCALTASVTREPAWAVATTAPFLGWVATNAAVFGYFVRIRGLAFTIGVLPLHWMCDFASGLGRAYGWLLRHTIGEPRPHPTVEAMSEVGVRTWPPLPSKPRPIEREKSKVS